MTAEEEEQDQEDESDPAPLSKQEQFKQAVRADKESAKPAPAKVL